MKSCTRVNTGTSYALRSNTIGAAYTCTAPLSLKALQAQTPRSKPCALALMSPVSMSQGLQAPGSGFGLAVCMSCAGIKAKLAPQLNPVMCWWTRGKASGQSSGLVPFRVWAGAHQEVRVCCGSCCAVDLGHVQRRHLHRQRAQGPKCSVVQRTRLVRANTYAVCHMQRTQTNSQGSRQSITWRAPLQPLQADIVSLHHPSLRQPPLKHAGDALQLENHQVTPRAHLGISIHVGHQHALHFDA